MSEGEEREEKVMSFWDHLAELSMRLRRIIIVVAVLTVLYMVIPVRLENFWDLMIGNFNYYTEYTVTAYVMNRIKRDMLGQINATLIASSFVDPITIYMEASFVLAVATALPYIAYEIYQFIAPGLYSHEKRFLKRFVLSSSILFTIGVIYGYVIIMPLTFRVLMVFVAMTGAEKLFTITDFYELVFLGLLANGFLFTLPVFLVMAFRFQFLNPYEVSKHKRYLYVVVLALAAILTPDPTPVSMLLLSIPFIILFEISLVIGKRVYPEETGDVKQ